MENCVAALNGVHWSRGDADITDALSVAGILGQLIPNDSSWNGKKKKKAEPGD